MVNIVRYHSSWPPNVAHRLKIAAEWHTALLTYSKDVQRFGVSGLYTIKCRISWRTAPSPTVAPNEKTPTSESMEETPNELPGYVRLYVLNIL